jgi:hypothetical protein
MNTPRTHPDDIECPFCRETCTGGQVTRSGLPAHFECQLAHLPRDEQNPGLLRYDGKARRDD